MKATELMIGDWVKYREGVGIIKSLDRDGTTMVAHQPVSDVNFGQDTFKFGFVIEYNAAKLLPIPITEEILLHNGAERKGNVFFLFGKFRLRCDDGFWKFTVVGEPFTYKIMHHVHELQQLLRLFGYVDIANDFQL